MSGEAKTITLKDNETAKIFGLSETDEYTVTEASYADDGYTTTIDNEEKLTATGTIKKDKEAGTTAGNGDKNITVVNDKTTNSPNPWNCLKACCGSVNHRSFQIILPDFHTAILRAVASIYLQSAIPPLSFIIDK